MNIKAEGMPMVSGMNITQMSSPDTVCAVVTARPNHGVNVGGARLAPEVRRKSVIECRSRRPQA